jgi:hypothetical protein
MIGLSIGLGLSRPAAAGEPLDLPTITDAGTISSSYSGHPGAAYSGTEATAEGADSTAYQWQIGGVDIATATNQNITQALTTGLSGVLRRKFTATNGDGDTVAYSNTITLTTRSLPTFVNNGAASVGTGAITVAQPASKQAGDLRFIVVESDNTTVATPSGFDALTHADDGFGTPADAAATRISSFWDVSAGTDSDATMADPGDHFNAREMAFRGGVSIVRLGGSAAVVAATPITWPVVSTPVDNCMVVLVATYAQDASTAVWGTPTVAALANVAVVLNAGTVQGNGGGLAYLYGEKAAAGSLGSLTASTSRAPDTFALAVYAVIPT